MKFVAYTTKSGLGAAYTTKSGLGLGLSDCCGERPLRSFTTAVFQYHIETTIQNHLLGLKDQHIFRAQAFEGALRKDRGGSRARIRTSFWLRHRD